MSKSIQTAFKQLVAEVEISPYYDEDTEYNIKLVQEAVDLHTPLSPTALGYPLTLEEDCGKCKATIESKWKFCPFCGQQIERQK